MTRIYTLVIQKGGVGKTTTAINLAAYLARMEQRVLVVDLDPQDGKYYYILIDCPPSLGILTVNGLVAARDGVLVPVQCEYLALEGLGQLTQTIERVQSALFPGLRVRGVILTMFDPRTNLSTDVVREVKNHFPG